MIIIAMELVFGDVPGAGVPVIVLTGSRGKNRNILFDFGKYPGRIGYESGPLSVHQRNAIQMVFHW